MKNKIISIISISVIVILFLQSCDLAELVRDKDTTNNLSLVSTKPVVELLGDPIMQLTVGGGYKEFGISAMAGDTVLDYTIVEGKVDANVEDFYVVTYEAVNGFGWATRAYRAVLVHDGTPYGDNIEGNYRKGFKFYSSISKASIDGYWQMENVWQEVDVDFPITFADKGDGTYGIVPGVHPRKGFYTGTATLQGNTLFFKIITFDSDGNPVSKDFDWTKY